MDISEIKDMVKEVVMEIYQKPRELGSFVDVLSTLGNQITKSKPAFTNPEQGRKLAYETVDKILLACKNIAKAALNKNNDEYKKGAQLFNHYREGLLMLLVLWARNINGADRTLIDKIDRPMNESKRHLEELAGQGSRIVDNLAGKDLERPNYINAMREFEHLKEIASNLKGSIDELFSLTRGLKFK